MSETVNIPVEFVASVLGTDPGVLAESLKSADGNLKPEAEIQQALKDVFGKKLGDARKTGLDEGYGRGKKEGLSSEEKKLAQKFEIAEYQGIEGLIDAIVSKTSQHSKLNPDDVRKSEHYITDIQAKNDEIKKLKGEFESFKGQVEFEKVSAKVNSAIKTIIENPDNKYVLPTNPTIRENLFNSMVNNIWRGEFKFDVNDKAIGVLDKEGQPIRDEMLVPVSFEDFVHGHAKGFFEIAQGDNRSGTGAQTQGAGAGQAFKFQNSEDYLKQYTSETDPIKRAAMKASFDQQVSKGLIK